MTTQVLEKEIYDYLSLYEYKRDFLLQEIIMENHYKNVRKIIEENTDIYSVFHYYSTWYDEQKNQWEVTDITSKNCFIINSDKEIILPFTPDENIIYKNKKLDSITEKIINTFKVDKDNLLVKHCINFCDENKEIVKKNTQLLENTQISKSIFDYKRTKFFTNNHNKRYFALKRKDNEKWGLVDFKGELIAPFIYDDLGLFTDGEGEYIHMGIGGKYGLLDCLGNVAIEPISDDIVLFYEGLAIIQQNKKFGFADTSGKIVIPVIYDHVTRFTFGKAEVQLNGEKFYINRKGERIDEC